MAEDLKGRAPLTSETLGPLVFLGLGLAMMGLALTQPAWIDGRIGPGLFGRWLSAAVIAMAMVWFVAARHSSTAPARRPARSADAPPLFHGIGLLAGVALFALALPMVGLVGASALAAFVVRWGSGTGEVAREWRACGIAALAGAAATLALGWTLLPPGTRLWPA
ncbi:MAG: tripartite tricarboxylate transporter TctB family protein [Pseudomonadota bacterium]